MAEDVSHLWFEPRVSPASMGLISIAQDRRMV